MFNNSYKKFIIRAIITYIIIVNNKMYNNSNNKMYNNSNNKAMCKDKNIYNVVIAIIFVVIISTLLL